MKSLFISDEKINSPLFPARLLLLQWREAISTYLILSDHVINSHNSFDGLNDARHSKETVDFDG